MANKINPRARRLGEQIQRELTELLRRDVKDERIGNVTITAVTVTGDLRSARVYYLIFGKDGADAKVQRGLESAAGFLRNALSKSLMIRYTPTLSFELDTSIEHGVRLTRLIDSVNKPRDTAVHDDRDAADPGDEGHVIDAGDYIAAGGVGTEAAEDVAVGYSTRMDTAGEDTRGRDTGGDPPGGTDPRGSGK